MGLDREEEQRLWLLDMEIERRECERSYYKFFCCAWNILNPETPFVDNWHIKYLCDFFQAEIERIAKGAPKTHDMIINIPPRSLKSTILTIMPCPWAWTRFPHLKFINHSHNQALSVDHCVKGRQVISSQWYQQHWGTLLYPENKKFALSSDINLKSHFANDRGGLRMTGNVGGHGGDVIVNDDPLDPEAADSEAARRSANYFNNTVFYSRLNDAHIGLRVIVMQRLDEEDPTGDSLSKHPSKYFHICLPAIAEEGEVKPKELMAYYKEIHGKHYFFPARFDEYFCADAKVRLGSYSYAGQYAQRPSPAEGGMFKRYYWNYWCVSGIDFPSIKIKKADEIITKNPILLPKFFDEKICSWDCAFKGKADSDNVCGQVWGRIGPDKFLIDMICDKMTFTQTCQGIMILKKRHPDTSCILIEDKANGPAVIEELKRIIPGIIPITVGTKEGDKVSRARPVERQAEGGNIYLPHPSGYSWVGDFIEECAVFPNAKHDDRIDCASQAINYLSQDCIRVVHAYQQHSPKHHKIFGVPWGTIPAKIMSGEGSLYASAWQKKDLSIGILLNYWDAIDQKLFVFDEAILQTPQAEVVLVEMKKHMRMLSEPNNIELEQFRWYVNDDMFSKKPGADGTADLFSKYNILMLTNDFYDEYGSISMLNRMFQNNMIIIHERCEIMHRQLMEWEVNQERMTVVHSGASENNHLVLCLCNIISVLYEHERKIVREVDRYIRAAEIMDRREAALRNQPTSTSWMGV